MKTDVIVIGAGAAGLMCAMQAAQRGRSVVVLDHARKLAEKIRISGGGRCNFTNLDVRPDHFLSANPHFCRSALARYTPQQFLKLLQQHRIGYHEKTLGQLFCDQGSEAIIALLKQECDQAGVKFFLGCKIGQVGHSPLAQAEHGFRVVASCGDFDAKGLVIASGGLSIPKIGATPFGYRIAEQFGIPVIKLKPGLVPLSFAPEAWKPLAQLSGLSLEAVVGCGRHAFREQLLFTHRGLSGPAILQISSYWEQGQALHIDLLPDCDIAALLDEHKAGKKLLSNFLAQWLPKHFADTWCAQQQLANLPLNQYNDRQRKQIAEQLHDWQITPSGTLGYARAEVTCGGVDTRALSSKTMACNDVSGLYFIGEVLDVTGQLGGYNLHWAWASGYAAGQAV